MPAILIDSTGFTGVKSVKAAELWRNSGGALALALLIFTAPWHRHWVIWLRPVGVIYYEYSSLIFYLSDGAALLLLCAALIARRRSGRAWQWGWRPVSAPLLLLAALAMGSAWWAGDAILSFYFGLRLLWLGGVYLAVVNLPPSPRLLQWSLAVSLGVQALVAGLQFWEGGALGWQGLGEINLNNLLGTTLRQGGWVRSAGLTPHPNILGGVLGTGLLALLPAALTSSGRARWRHLLLLLALAAGWLTPLSRSALLGVALGMGFMMTMWLLHPAWRARWGRMVGGAAAAGLAVLAGLWVWQPPQLWQRLADRQPWDTRLILNQAAYQMIGQFPWGGVGASNFSIAAIPYVGAAAVPQPAHNLPLLLSAELGLAGGAIWLWLMLLPAIWTARRVRQGQASLWEVGLAAGLVALAVIDLFDFYSWGWAQGRLWRWLWLALWVAAVQRPAPATPPPPTIAAVGE